MGIVGQGKVYLEGVEINGAIGCNVADGWIDCVTSSPSGYCNQDVKPSDVLTSRLYGFVEFVPFSPDEKPHKDWLWGGGGDLGVKIKSEPEKHSVGKLTVEVDYSEIVAATEQTNKLAEAIERVEAARRGPIEYAAVGDVFTIRFGGDEWETDLAKQIMKQIEECCGNKCFKLEGV